MRVPQNNGWENTSVGAFLFIRDVPTVLRVIASVGGGWDHVSVSTAERCPTWEEMCFVKNAFFRPDEVVMQLHPAEKDYVNCHNFCLHLWRPQTPDERKAIGDMDETPVCPTPPPIPLPPSFMVGPK